MERTTDTKLNFEGKLEGMSVRISGRYRFLDYGPLAHVSESRSRNFVFGLHNNENEYNELGNFVACSYAVVTAEKPLTLHRLFGGEAREIGQYWTLEQRERNFGYRLDLGVLEEWNTLEFSTTLEIPKGVRFIVGEVAAQGFCLGGGLQAFIPRQYLEPLFEYNKATDPTVKKQKLEEVFAAQKKFFDQYSTHKAKVRGKNPNEYRYRQSISSQT